MREGNSGEREKCMNHILAVLGQRKNTQMEILKILTWSAGGWWCCRHRYGPSKNIDDD